MGESHKRARLSSCLTLFLCLPATFNFLHFFDTLISFLLFGQELHAGVFAGAHELVAFLLRCVLPAIGPGRAECSHLSMRVLTRWWLLFCFPEKKSFSRSRALATTDCTVQLHTVVRYHSVFSNGTDGQRTSEELHDPHARSARASGRHTPLARLSPGHPATQRGPAAQDETNRTKPTEMWKLESRPCCAK